MRVSSVAAPGLPLTLLMYLSAAAGTQAQTTPDGGQLRSQLTLSLRSVAIAFPPALDASQPEHDRLLSGAETATVPRVKVAELDAPTLLRLGTLDGDAPDEEGEANDGNDGQPGSRKYDLWLTRPPRASQGGDDWRLELNTPGGTGIPGLVGMVPLSHTATADSTRWFAGTVVPTAEDAGQLVLQWGSHRWTADFSFAASPNPPEQTEEERAEAQRERNEQNRRDFDSDTTAIARFTRLGERHETAIDLPDDSQIQVLFWKKIGADHSDFSRIATPSDGEVIRLTGGAALRLKTEVGLRFGDVDVPTDNLAPNYPGHYGLWLKRSGGGWRLVFNNEPDSWGTQYDPAFDAAEIRLTHSKKGPASRPLGAALIPKGADRGTLVIHWGAHEWSADFTTGS